MSPRACASDIDLCFENTKPEYEIETHGVVTSLNRDVFIVCKISKKRSYVITHQETAFKPTMTGRWRLLQECIGCIVLRCDISGGAKAWHFVAIRRECVGFPDPGRNSVPVSKAENGRPWSVQCQVQSVKFNLESTEWTV